MGSGFIKCAIFFTILLRVDNFTPQPFFRPIPTIRPIYFYHNPTSHHPQHAPTTFRGSDESNSNQEESGSVESGERNDTKIKLPVDLDDKVQSDESMEVPLTQRKRLTTLLGDKGVMEDPSHEDRFRHLWPFATTTVTLTKTKKSRSPYHFHSHHAGHHPLPDFGYDHYVEQMENTAKGHDYDGLFNYNDHGDGWDGDQYGLTDEEILHSKGYEKYRKNLKKNAKHLKKKLALVKWFQKFLVEKKFFYPGITELDVIAPN